jgi:hypothetical protein
MKKRKKYGIIFAITVFIIVFIIAFILSIEVNKVYERNGENSYSIETVKNIQPFNYNTDAMGAWLIGIIIIPISLYVAFIKIKEKDINKAQIIILATTIPVILFISFSAVIQLLNIPTLADAWFFIVVMLILIAVFEYDLFGNKTIISFFDFKLLIKMIVLSIILFFVIGILGELIPAFKQTTTSPITKEEYENYKGRKIDRISNTISTEELLHRLKKSE